MHLNFPFTETVSLIKKRFGKIEELDYVNNKTGNIGYEASIIGCLKKKFSINITVIKVEELQKY